MREDSIKEMDMQVNEVNLTAEQKECINFNAESDLIIRGEAGSGKSLVIIKRAIKLYDKSKAARENAKIIIFTFTNSLVRYTSELISRERGDISENIKVKTLDSVICDLYKALTRRSLYDIYDDYMHVLNQVIEQLQYTKYPGKVRFFDYGKREFLLDELKWMKQHMFTTATQYKNCVRVGRGSVRVAREERSVIYDVYKLYYSQLRLKKKKTIDMICDEIVRLYEIPEKEMYDYVLVDEAQDLSLSKMMIASYLAKNSITIAADFSQKIYRTGFTWKEIGVKINSQSSKKLYGTHCNSKQIAMLANGLLKKTDLDQYDDITVSMQIPTREGPKPILKYEPSYNQEEFDIISLIKNILRQNSKARIAVLCYGGGEIKRIAKWLRESDVTYQKINRMMDYEMLLPGVKLVTYHSAKGLEFDYVIMPFLDEDIFPDVKHIDKKDKNAVEDCINRCRILMYVGITRATTALYMFACKGADGVPSKLLRDLDKNAIDVIRENQSMIQCAIIR